MGRLGWTADAALNADPQMILLAYEGYGAERREFERIIYGAQGIRLPEEPKAKPTGRQLINRWRQFTQEHNNRREQRAVQSAPPAKR